MATGLRPAAQHGAVDARGSVPVVVMLAGLGFFHLKTHVAAGAGLIAALAIAILAYGMPADMAGKAALLYIGPELAS